MRARIYALGKILSLGGYMEPKSCKMCGTSEDLVRRRRFCLPCFRQYQNKLYRDRRALLNKLLKEMSMNELHGV